MQRLAFAVLGIALVVAGAIGWLGLSYLAVPVSTLGAAYVIGARVALTADWSAPLEPDSLKLVI